MSQFFVVVFSVMRKTGLAGEKSSEQRRDQQKTQPTYAARQIELGPHSLGGERSQY